MLNFIIGFLLGGIFSFSLHAIIIIGKESDKNANYDND